MVCLDHAALQNVRVDGSLCQEADIIQLSCLFLEDADKFAADDFSLLFGTTHSCQYAMAAILKAANEGRINILDGVREYAERAHAMKELFTKYGFEIVYDRDLEEPIADGFYFTIIYPGFSGGDLTKEILYYGISAIPLRDTGSKKQGLRACVSQTGLNWMPELEERLKRFAADHTK